jgi:hypothetical protein
MSGARKARSSSATAPGVDYGSRLDGKAAQLIALKLPFEMAMSNQLMFAGDDAGLERALLDGSARVATA